MKQPRTYFKSERAEGIRPKKKKRLACLAGHSEICKGTFMTTAETRICEPCKALHRQVDYYGGFEVHLDSLAWSDS